jgi:hypothetical protein
MMELRLAVDKKLFTNLCSGLYCQLVENFYGLLRFALTKLRYLINIENASILT